MTDEALEWLRRDQESSGLSVREYERKYGVMLSPARARPGTDLAGEIAKHEVSLHDLSETIGVRAHCRACSEPPSSEDGS